MRLFFHSRLWILPLAAVVLSGCPDRVVPVEVKVVKDVCGKAPDPMQDVSHLRVRVLHDDGRVISEDVRERGAGQTTLEELPSGERLRLQVTGFNGAPGSGGVIVSHGTSAAFQVPEEIVDGAPATKVNVFLRQVERFSPVVSAEDPANTCTTLSVERAGHTATLLDDGRVLIAGGFEAENNNRLGWNYRETVEIFDPATGEVITDTPPMQFNGRPTSRAFHSATLLPNGQVLLAGGEYSYSANGKPLMTTLAQAVLFDPTVNKGTGGWIATAMTIKRSRHTATVVTPSDGLSRVLFIGGVDWNNADTPKMVEKGEWFEPVSNEFRTTDGVFKRVGHAALTTLSGQIVAVVGGHDGEKLYAEKNEVRFFQFQNDAFAPSESRLDLMPPRSGVAVAPLGSEGQFIVLGGFQSADLTNPTSPYAGSDIINVRNGLRRSDGPNMDLPRGHICTVSLKDGRVLAIGGRGRPGPDDNQESLALTNIVSESDGEVQMIRGDSLADARYFHTCTLLQDGTVLVAGGVAEKGGAFGTLRSLEIFQPRPVE